MRLWSSSAETHDSCDFFSPRKALHDFLRGIRPCLVNASDMNNLPERRTRWRERQWLNCCREGSLGSPLVLSFSLLCKLLSL